MGFQLSRFQHSVNATGPASDLSIQFTIDERYQGFLARAVPSEIFGTKVPVACLEDLVNGKVWAWSDARRHASKRKKDELDILRLAEAFPEIPPLCPASILA